MRLSSHFEAMRHLFRRCDKIECNLSEMHCCFGIPRSELVE